MKMRHCGIRNIILIWNIYLTILIPFVVLLSRIWHLESGVRHGKAAGLPIAVILAFLPLVLFGLKWKMDSTFTIIASCVWFIFMWKMAYYFFYDKFSGSQYYCVDVEHNSKRIQTFGGTYFEISARSMAGSMFGEL